MSMARTARRRRKQHMNGFTHIAKMGRPKYRRRQLANIQDAIAAERARAVRMANMKKAKK